MTVAEIHTGKPTLHRFARADTDTLLEPPEGDRDDYREAYKETMGPGELPRTFGYMAWEARMARERAEREKEGER